MVTRAPLSEPRPRRGWRWALLGLVIGVLAAVVLFAPARWLSAALSDWTQGRLVLANPRGTVWNGTATVVFANGSGSSGSSATRPAHRPCRCPACCTGACVRAGAAFRQPRPALLRRAAARTARQPARRRPAAHLAGQPLALARHHAHRPGRALEHAQARRRARPQHQGLRHAMGRSRRCASPGRPRSTPPMFPPACRPCGRWAATASRSTAAPAPRCC
jgi:hypothetical protein